MDENLRKYFDDLRKKLRFPDIKFPDVSWDQIEENTEMIASEDEDSILLFQEGILTKPELIECLQRGYCRVFGEKEVKKNGD